MDNYRVRGGSDLWWPLFPINIWIKKIPRNNFLPIYLPPKLPLVVLILFLSGFTLLSSRKKKMDIYLLPYNFQANSFLSNYSCPQLELNGALVKIFHLTVRWVWIYIGWNFWLAAIDGPTFGFFFVFPNSSLDFSCILVAIFPYL